MVRAVLIALLVAAAAAPAEAGVHARVAQSDDPAADDTSADPAKATDAARSQLAASEKKRAALIASRGDLATSYQQQLAAVDALKRQKASWRRDRQLKAELSSSLDTARALGQASADISALDAKLVAQRRTLIAAIDAELATAPGEARGKMLRAARARAVAANTPPKKIVIPDDEIDPLADPDELDAQAKALRSSETELQKQVDSLDDEAARFQKQADLRKEHQRAGEMASRDDDQPRRTSGTGGGGRNGDAANPNPTPQGGGPENNPTSDPQIGGGGSNTGLFEGDPAVVLSDVVDSDTVETLRKAERSTDPATKAAAASRAREAVAKRLAALAKRRAEIEARAKALRQ